MDPVLVTRPPTGAPTDRSRRALVLVTVCLALFLALLDSTAVSIALPLVARDLDTGMSGLQWTADSYVLVAAALLLTSGTLGDRIGRKPVFLAGIALFTAGSAVSALAGSLPVLVAGRAVQGLGAAGMSPQTLAILGVAFPERRDRARALGIWSGVSGLALVLGPLAGGALAGRWGWQSIFWLNVPLGVLAFATGARVIPAPPPRRTRRIDLTGQVLAVGALTALTFGVIRAGGYPWRSPTVLVPLALAAGCLAGFALAELRAAEPMLSASLLRSRAFVGSILVLFLVAAGMYASFFLISLELQNGHGLTPAAAGVRLLPAMATAVLTAPLAGRLAGRVGERMVVTAATALAGTGLLLLSLTGPGRAWWPALVLLGAGVGGTFSPTNSALLGGVPPDSAGVAAALGQLCQQAGTAIGVAALGAATSLVLQDRLRGAPVGPEGAGTDPARLAHELFAGTERAGGDLAGVGSQPLLQAGLTAGVQCGLLLGVVAFLTAAVSAGALIPAHRPAVPPAEDGG